MVSNVLLSVELNYCWFNFAKQQQLLHVHHVPSLHDFDVKMPN